MQNQIFFWILNDRKRHKRHLPLKYKKIDTISHSVRLKKRFAPFLRSISKTLPIENEKKIFF